MKHHLAIITVILLAPLLASAQQPATLHHPEALYAHAMELYDKEKFTAAQREFEEVQAHVDDPYREIAVNAEYYAARCAMHLFHKDTRERLVQFVHDHPESMHIRTAYFELANYYYSRKQYRNALEWYDKVEAAKLTVEETNDYHFKRGYSQFKRKEYSAAKQSFSHLIDEPNRYYAPANYYYAHLAYMDGNYEAALKGFRLLESDENFATVAPYYITQILFLQEKYDEVVSYGPSRIDSARVKKEHEVARIIGESFYNLQQYEEAVPYLQQFRDSQAPKQRQDHYQLGFALYKTGAYEEALDAFNLVTNADDELSQVATYHMGESYLKLDNKKYARNAFKESSKYDYDRPLQEDALFNYAKLAYELSVNPFHEAIRAFEQYLEDYPTSERRDDAYAFLLEVYLTTRDYQAALDALDKIEEKDIKAKTAYQLSAYNRGVELFLNRKFIEARSYFMKVDTYNIDPTLTALAEYWMAEILYREKQYDQAILAYREFQNDPGSFDTEYFKEAYYSTAYAYFMQKEYRNAQTAFNLYLNSKPGADDKKMNDTYLRLGDCAFVAKEYNTAISYYDQAIALDKFDTDYALFQKARSQGFKGDDVSKTNTLEEIIRRYTKSSYLVPAKYQLAETFFKMDKNDQAFVMFEDIIDNHSGSPYVKKSLLTMGLIHFRRGAYEDAIASFKQVVEDYPQDEDSQEAQARIQDVYVELGRMDEFNEWYEQHVPTGSVAAQDSVNYRAAENKYSAGDCEGAITAFTSYIQKFQPGIFGINASYYLGECLFQRGDTEIALNNYLYVIGQPTNQFSEPALFSAATITYEAGRYDEALEHYQALERVATFDNNILEARIGQMRCHFQLGQYDQALTYCDAVLADDNSPEYILKEAHFIKAKVLLSQNDVPGALLAFRKVDQMSTGKMGAESKFNIARIIYNRQEYTESEEEIFELIQQYPSQEFWKIKAFLLLADVYTGMEDYFQAKATLQSIIDNVQDEGIRAEAIAKYEAIVAIEQGASEGVEEDMEIEVGGEGGETPGQSEQDLFDGEE
ncbi:MAG: tetratricopeptide repeat protein [Flavobacteriales bacterium]|nr:tetratricopeptide repeat protein [Flavobacteriales bacterium]